jgi:hypothetical protein
VLNILTEYFLWTLLCSMQGPCAYNVFICGLPPSTVSFTLFHIGSGCEKNKQGIECFSWFLKKLCLKLFYLKKLFRYYDKRKYAFYKISDKLVEYQRNSLQISEKHSNVKFLENSTSEICNSKFVILELA